jgi:hypothetical protein
MLSEKWVIFAVVLQLVLGEGSYIIATLRGRTQPNRVTWLLWAVAPLIAFAAEVRDGVGLQVWMTFIFGFGPALVFIASFVNRRAVWKLGWFDFMCGALSLLGLALWWGTRTNEVAILFAIAADTFAAIPTIIKAYRHPETEHVLIFWLAIITGTITLLTVDHWTISNYGFPLYIVVCCLIIAAPITFSRSRSRGSLLATQKG